MYFLNVLVIFWLFIPIFLELLSFAAGAKPKERVFFNYDDDADYFHGSFMERLKKEKNLNAVDLQLQSKLVPTEEDDYAESWEHGSAASGLSNMQKLYSRRGLAAQPKRSNSAKSLRSLVVARPLLPKYRLKDIHTDTKMHNKAKADMSIGNWMWMDLRQWFLRLKVKGQFPGEPGKNITLIFVTLEKPSFPEVRF